MWYAIAFLAAALIYVYVSMPDQPAAKSPDLDDIQVPTAEVGRPIPVLFGTREIKGANVVWDGDFGKDRIENHDTIVRYRLFVGMHTVLCHGCIDSINKLTWDGKDFWTGRVSSGSFFVNRPNFMGGATGAGNEGGLIGNIDVLPGLPTQTVNNYLQEHIGEKIPAYRGVSSLVWRGDPSTIYPPHGDNHGTGFYWGTNPYLKPVAVWAQRIHLRSDGSQQWYDEKAAVPPVGNALYSTKYLQTADNPYTFSNPGQEDSWSTDPSDYSTQASGLNPAWPTGVGATGLFWIIWDFPDGLHADLTILLTLNYDDSGKLLSAINAVTAPSNAPNPVPGYPRRSGLIVTIPRKGGPFQTRLCFACVDSVDIETGEGLGSTSNHKALLSQLQVNAGDMNPAHIIRECLTDSHWGMGYLESDIDDANFKAAADALYSEGMGMSLLWAKQQKLQTFIQTVCNHINGTVYVSRKTGKFKLALVRDDYDPNSLTEYGPGDIASLEGFTIQSGADLVNSITVNFWNRDTGDTDSLTDTDAALVQQWGQVVARTNDYPGFTSRALASRIAKRDRLTASTPLISCQINGNRGMKNLEIGDVFKLYWPEFLGEQRVVMRVINSRVGDGRKNSVTLKVVQDQFSLPSAGSIGVTGSAWIPQDNTALPVGRRIVTEMPYREWIRRGDTQPQVDAHLAAYPDAGQVVASGQQPSAAAFAADVWSDSGAGYVYDTTTHFAVTAVLLAVLPQELGPSTIAVESSGFVSGNVGDTVQIDDEILVVQAVGTGTLTLGRGCLDTVPARHEAGAIIYGWDNAAAALSGEYSKGQNVGVKELTKTSAETLDIASAPADSITLAGRASRPYPPGSPKFNGAAYPDSLAGQFTVSWLPRNKGTQGAAVSDTKATGIIAPDNYRVGLRFLDSAGAVLASADNIDPETSPTVELNPTAAGLGYGKGYGTAYGSDGANRVTCEVWAVNNYNESLYRHQLHFTYTPDGTPANTITSTAYTPVDDSTIIDGGEI